MSVEHDDAIKGAAGINIVLGVLVFLTPFLTGATTAAPLWSAMLAGAAIVLFAVYNAIQARERHTEDAAKPAVVNMGLGLWVLLSGFILAAGPTYTTAMVVYGAMVIIAAGYNAWAGHDARRFEYTT